MNRQTENSRASLKNANKPHCTHPIKGRTITIACYRRPYSKSSLLHIKGLLKQECPARVVILRILEVGEKMEIVDAGLGFGDIQEFEESFEKDQKKRITGFFPMYSPNSKSPFSRFFAMNTGALSPILSILLSSIFALSAA